MTFYRKGSMAEHELIRLFEGEGFACIRSAGSHKLDVIAARNHKVMAFEVKSHSSANLYIEDGQYKAMAEWLRISGIMIWVAWKVPQKGFFFIKMSEFHKSGKNWGISQKEALGINRRLEAILAMFGFMEQKGVGGQTTPDLVIPAQYTASYGVSYTISGGSTEISAE